MTNTLPFPNNCYYMAITIEDGERVVDFCRLRANIQYLISCAEQYLVIGDEGEVVDQAGDWDVDEEIERFVDGRFRL